LLRLRQDALGEPRFGMLETIREYGLERLALAGEEADSRRRHAEWCIALVKRAEPELLGADQQHWFARLLAEQDNLRAALGWAIGAADAETALALVGSLYRFWATEGLYEEGRRWLEQALALAPGAITAARGNALLGLGVMLFFQGDFDEAAALWEESLALFTALQDRTGIAYSHGNLGLIADAREDYERAIGEYEAALALFRELGDRKYVAYMLHNLGLIAYFQGEYRRATALFEESLAAIRTFGDQNSIAMTLGNLGLVAFAEGDYQRALTLQREALADRQLISNKPWLVRTIENFAQIAAATNQPERAVRLFAAAASLRDAFGASLPPNDRALIDRHLELARTQISDDVFAGCWKHGEQLSLEEAIGVALGETTA
jgi:non-specific serine/threonine protein kinase